MVLRSWPVSLDSSCSKNTKICLISPGVLLPYQAISNGLCYTKTVLGFGLISVEGDRKKALL